MVKIEFGRWWRLNLVGGGVAKKVSRLLPAPGGVSALGVLMSQIVSLLGTFISPSDHGLNIDGVHYCHLLVLYVSI